MSHSQQDAMNPLAWLHAWQQSLGLSTDPSVLFPWASGLPFPDDSAIPLAPEKAVEIQQEFAAQWSELCSAAMHGKLGPLADQRFAGEAWGKNPFHSFMAHAYLLSTRTLLRMADSVEGPEHTRNRLRFAIVQWVDALAPSNFLAFNPDAQQRLIDSGGESLQHGLANLLTDLQKGRISQSDESSFQVGATLAATPGSVVFENKLFQLIQYQALTSKTYARPLLIVPPCINKFYVLDLQEHNSFVRYALEQGMQVFLVSWRNPLPSDTDGVEQSSWDDYLDEGVLRAITVTQEISGQKQINTLGFCVGGTLLASALALAKARGAEPAASLTLLTTLLDFHDTGILDVFIDEAQVLLREQQFAHGGLLPARDLATTFAFLRPNDLVWNYVVNNYLKGQAPSPFDLLYWNADSTNLPGPFYAWYLRNTYLENNLKVPGRTSACGTALDLTQLDMPAYIYGSREDHIVPWASAYASTAILQGPARFVLGASGHIAGVINPATRNRRNYWVHERDDALPEQAEAWLEGAKSVAGSWWGDWAAWLQAHGGRQIKAKAAVGNKQYPAIEPAPGRYVQIKAV